MEYLRRFGGEWNVLPDIPGTGGPMNRRVAPLKQHPLARRIVASSLAWLMAVGAFPASALPALPAQHGGAAAFRAVPSALLPEPAAPVPPDPASAAASDPREDEKWGEITVAQPKIWQYERVNSLLDGLSRDVQGVSMSDLTSLDPNVANGAAVKFVQSMLEIGAKYDQGAAATNAITLKNYAASQQIASAQLQANAAYLQQLDAQRTTITGQLLLATQQNAMLQGQLASTSTSDPTYASLTTQEQAAASAVTGLQAELTSINNQITAASSTTIPPAPSLTSTTAGAPPETANTFSSFLSSLPSGLTSNIVNQLQTPSLPATKRLDNFITLLYERLAREISVLQDDVMRDPESVPYLVQFDVGLYPGVRAKDHVGVVEFTMDCKGCKVYAIYPGQSSYNLANYEGASKRYSFWGNLATLIGLGVSADYRRQTDTLHGDLVQSVYISGFQEGGPSIPRGEDSEVEQRFGWYYGAAPFESLVTPGIRSTFAIISVPRSLLKTCFAADPPNSSWMCGKGMQGETDEYGAKQILLKVKAHADWMRRDNPYYQQRDSLPNSLPSGFWNGMSWVTGTSLNLKKSGNFKISKDLTVVLPGTHSINDVPNVVLAERNQLHVLGMEYNPVYYTPPPKPAPDASANSTPPSLPPGTASASASGAGTGTTTVTVSGAGTASASSSGTTGTTATATATNPTTTPSSPPSPPDPLTGCKQGLCAAVLIKLAEPVDPNLVVTVKGLPLRRVLDWHGRATSILPAAQSNSDIAPSAAGATTNTSTTQPQRSEITSSAALLQADQLGPNTWMEVDSHRVLLNISKDLAGEEEFPTIQIFDPAKKALIIPHQLDQGFSEIVTNGFHLPTRDEEQLREHISHHFRNSRTPSPRLASGTILNPAGPYASETFLPLFLPDPDPQRIYAYLGETGVQLLIGFVNDLAGATVAPSTKHKWISAQQQVILEDRDLDLDWSLSCDVQGADLVCDIPQREIRTAYDIVGQVCSSNGLPGPNPCPSILRTSSVDELSVSTLQVWVEQHDPDGEDSFYTPSPARISRFPLELTRGSGPDVGFSPWHFELATPEYIKLAGCQYPQFPPLGNALRIIGQHIPVPYRDQSLTPGDLEAGCFSFVIPTVALTHSELVVEYAAHTDPALASVPLVSAALGFPYTLSTHPCPAATPMPATPPFPPATTPCKPEPLTTFLFRPYFENPRVVQHRDPKTQKISSWTVEIPAGRVEINDSIDATDLGKLCARWVIGATNVKMMGGLVAPPCPAVAIPAVVPNFAQASKTGQLRLVLEISKENLGLLAPGKPLHILRGPNQDTIATLPDIRSLILPNQLNVVSLGNNQFGLQGDHAEVIDAVAVQGPGGFNKTIPTATAAQIALVTLTDSSSTSAPAKAATPPKAGTPGMPVITKIDPDSDPTGTRVEITGKNFGTKPGSVSFTKDIDAPVLKNCWTDTSIIVDVPANAKTGPISIKNDAGTYTSTSPFTVEEAPNKPQALGCPAPASNNKPSPAVALKPGTYTIVPLVALSNDGKGTILYQPIDVLDPKGNPLTFTVPVASKDTTAANPPGTEGPTTTVTISKKTTVTPAPKSASTTSGAGGASK
jgi:hypothetical protein